MADTENTRAPAGGSEPTDVGHSDWVSRALTLAAEYRLAPENLRARYFDQMASLLDSVAASAPAAAPLPLTDEACDRATAQTMDRVAAAKGLEHAMHLVTDIAVSHTLRRELIRAGYALAIARECRGTPAAAPKPLTDESAWTTLDTYAAHEAVSMLKLPAPITWTQLHKFAQEVAARAIASRGNPAAGEPLSPAMLIEVAHAASAQGHVTGTTNWAIAMLRALAASGHQAALGSTGRSGVRAE